MGRKKHIIYVHRDDNLPYFGADPYVEEDENGVVLNRHYSHEAARRSLHRRGYRYMGSSQGWNEYTRD